MKYCYALLASTALITSAHAATFSADGATASSDFSGGYVAENTINGSGLPAGFGAADVHDQYAFGNHWTTASGTNPTDGSITWTFASSTTVGGVYFWNHLSNGIASNPGYDVTVFDLTFLDASNSVLKTFDDVDMTPNSAGISEAFTLANPLTGVFGVRFDIEAVDGSSNFTGLAEVLFSDAVIAGAVELEPSSASPVPLPASALLLGAGLLGFGAFGRRHRQKHS